MEEEEEEVAGSIVVAGRAYERYTFLITEVWPNIIAWPYCGIVRL
jgi:hypothetical protein